MRTTVAAAPPLAPRCEIGTIGSKLQAICSGRYDREVPLGRGLQQGRWRMGKWLAGLAGWPDWQSLGSWHARTVAR